jgi:recombinational DNA repair protein (RecF pathway)
MSLQKCVKCGALVFSVEPYSSGGLCLRCSRLEAAKKMSFKFE